jgi:hypothetical protein
VHQPNISVERSTRRSSASAAGSPTLLKLSAVSPTAQWRSNLARYLNVPPASLPGESSEGLDDRPSRPRRSALLLSDTFDRQQQIGAAARLVARHLTLGHSPDGLIATLAQALLREDAGFHAYQMLEAGVR